jgi:thiol:disulfide interchange protein DsbG
MHLNRLLISALAAATLLLAACSPQKDAAPAAPAKPAVSIEAIASQAKGFTVGAMMSSTTVYVFFDPQCPHCGHLWQESMPLQKKLRFVWIPCGWINPKSLPQGAALLAASDPQALMTQHEASLLAGTGGLPIPESIAPEIEQAVKANTKLLNSYGAESVPFFVAKNARTGEVIRHEGAMNTADLANLIGVDPTL